MQSHVFDFFLLILHQCVAPIIMNNLLVKIFNVLNEALSSATELEITFFILIFINFNILMLIFFIIPNFNFYHIIYPTDANPTSLLVPLFLNSLIHIIHFNPLIPLILRYLNPFNPLIYLLINSFILLSLLIPLLISSFISLNPFIPLLPSSSFPSYISSSLTLASPYDNNNNGSFYNYSDTFTLCLINNSTHACPFTFKTKSFT